MQTTFTTSLSTVLREKNIHIVAVLISLVLSAWAVYSDGIVNRDGIIYLEAAARLGQGQWSAALSLYDWPFYSCLIALMSHLTGFGIETSAQLLNALLFALMVYAFIGLIEELGGHRTTLIAAALIILLYPQLNEHRADIFRDNGYWAFYLISVWLFIRYFKTPRLRYAWAWGASIIITLLFRIEGMAFLLLLPLTLMLKHDIGLSRRLLVLAGAYLVGFTGLILLLAWWIISPEAVVQSIGRLDEPLSWFQYLGQDLSTHLQEQSARLSEAILNRFSENHALHAVIATLVTILVLDTSSAISLVYALLLLHSFISGTFQSRLPANMWGIIVWLVVINLMVLSLFLVKMFFLTGRYPVPLALTLMLILPFHLIYLKERWDTSLMGSRLRKVYLVLIGIVVFGILIDGLVSFGPSKQHIKAAGLWIAHEAPASAKLYTNDEVVAYYAGRWQAAPYDGYDETLQQLRVGTWRDFNYLAIRVRKHEEVLEATARQAVGNSQVKVFKNDRGEKLLIFQVQPVRDRRLP